jgi:hypothetical protein
MCLNKKAAKSTLKVLAASLTKRYQKGVMASLFTALASYLAASGAASGAATAAFSAAFLCDLCALCIFLALIGAGAASGVGTATAGAAVSSAAKAPIDKVAAKKPANNATNNLFMFISFKKLTLVLKITN